MFNSQLIKLLFSAIFLFLYSNLNAQLNGSYTINSASPTLGNNFQSFSDFENALTLNGVSDTVLVNIIQGSGPYNERVIFTSYSGVSATNPIIINGNGEELSFNSTFSDKRVLGFEGTEYFTIKNLIVKTLSSDYGFAIHFRNNSNNITIDSCYIDLSSITNNGTSAMDNSAGILSCNSIQSTSGAGKNASSIVIQNSTIDGGTNTAGMYYGIRFNGLSQNDYDSNIVILNNIVSNAYRSSIVLQSISNATIAMNDIHRLNKITALSFNGIYITNCVGTDIHSNKIHATHTSSNSLSGTSYGIRLVNCNGTSANPTHVYNNLLYDFNGDDDIYGIFTNRASYTKIYHNTVSINNITSSSNSDIYGARMSNGGGTEFFNNIISINKNGSGDRNAISISSFSSGISSNYNILYVTGSGYKRIGILNSSTYTSLSTWQMVNNGEFDQNSFEADPKLISTTDLTPRDTNPDGTGLFVGISTDFFGNPRSNNPDIGAIEFTPETCFIPDNLIAEKISSTSSRISWTETFISRKWQIEYGLHNFIRGTGNFIIANDSSTLILNNLLEGKFYDFYVRAICSAGDTTEWSESKQFYNSVIPLSGVYSIDKNQDTLSRNFVSFRQFTLALESVGLSGAVTTNVISGSGPYTEALFLKHYQGISANSNITINGNNEKIEFAPNILDKRIVGLDSARFITLKNLKIKSLSTKYAYGIHFYDYCNDITIDSCEIDLSEVENSSIENSGGIIQSRSFISTLNGFKYIKNINITNSKFFGGYNQGLYYGISLQGQFNYISDSNIVIANNYIWKFNSIGIKVRNVIYSSIQNNLISNNDLINSISGTGISSSNNSEGLIVESNRIKNLNGITLNFQGIYYGMDFSFTRATANNPLIVSNNIIHDNNVNSSFYGIKSNSATHAKFYHNTVYLNCDTNDAIMEGLSHSGNITFEPGVEFKNNLIKLEGGKGNFGPWHSGIKVSDRIVCDYNNIDVTNSNVSRSSIGKFGSGNYYYSLSQWQSAQSSSFGANSLAVNPQFNDLEDFTPASTQLNNQGDNLQISQDYYGDARAINNPDIGAVEFEPCLFPNQIILNALSGDSIQMSWSNPNATSVWEIEYGVSGFLRGYGLNFITDTTSVIIDSLLPNTLYDFYVRSNCDSNIVSVFSTVSSQRTLCVPSYDTISITTCDSYLWEMDSNIYNTSGFYSDTLINVIGCDSIVYLDLTINLKTISTFQNTSCDQYTWPQSGITYSNTGTYYDTLTNSVGCDSILTLDLTINNSTNNTLFLTACDSFIWTQNSSNYKNSGIYSDTITNSLGCDSVLFLDLTINQSNDSIINVTSCYFYQSPSRKYIWSISGTYTDSIFNVNNCDSILTINLQILDATFDTLNLSACDTLIAPSGKKLYLTGVYNDTIVNANGCDSINTINLTILNTQSAISPIVCNNYTSPSGLYNWNTTGVYFDTLSNINNCDSLITINLTVLETYTTIQPTVCNQYNSPSGKTYTTSGIYSDTLTNISLCDSIITIILTINNSTYAIINDTACISYLSPSGKLYTTSGTYKDTIANAVGCDSLMDLNIVIFNNTASSLIITTCDSLIAPSGKVLYTGGLFNDTILNINGCDSIITLFLTINQSFNRIDNVVACNNYILPDRRTVTTNGVYTSNLLKVNGCDSIITTNLTINQIDTSIIRIGNTLISNLNNVTYQWLDCNANFSPILNATNQSYTPVQNGSYAVEVSLNCSDTSRCVTILSVGLNKVNKNLKNEVSIYPTPFSELLYIDNPLEQKLTIQVYTLTGKLVKSLIHQSNQIKLNIDAARGVYFIHVKSNNTSEVYKVIKK